MVQFDPVVVSIGIAFATMKMIRKLSVSPIFLSIQTDHNRTTIELWAICSFDRIVIGDRAKTIKKSQMKNQTHLVNLLDPMQF